MMRNGLQHTSTKKKLVIRANACLEWAVPEDLGVTPQAMWAQSQSKRERKKNSMAHFSTQECLQTTASKETFGTGLFRG